MTSSQHIHPDDLSLHAMHLLSASEAAAIQAHMQQCTECARAFQDAQRDLAVVALTVPLEVPRPQVRLRFLERVAQERRAVTAVEPAAIPVIAAQVADQTTVVTPIDAPRRKSAGSSLLPWLGWAVAAGASFFAFSEYRQTAQLQSTVAEQRTQLQTETTKMAALSAEAVKARALMDTLTGSDAQRVVLNTTPAAKALPQARANYIAGKGSLVFIASNLQPLPIDKIYELWIIPADGSAPVAVGTFAPDGRGNASLVMPQIPKGVEAKAFGVTLEAEGGSAKPTLPILLVGAA